MSRPAAGCGLSGTLDLERELPFNWKQAIGNWATKPIPRKLHSIESPNHTKSKPHIFQSHPRGRQIPVIMPQDMPPVGGYGPVQYKVGAVLFFSDCFGGGGGGDDSSSRRIAFLGGIGSFDFGSDIMRVASILRGDGCLAGN